LLLSLIAGMATTIGAAIALVVKHFSGKTLSVLLGFAAGVMITVSFVELYASSIETIGMVRASLAFFSGFGIIFLVDVLVPHEYETEAADEQAAQLQRAGVLTAVGIAIHNLPEGLVVLSGAATSEKLGLLLTIAIAVHNIPEGIAVSVPIAAATGNRMKAFMYSFLSGLAEPVGALLGALVLIHVMTEVVNAAMLAGVGGLMVFISLDELLPTAHRYGEAHAATIGVLAGMAVMAATLAVLG
ncbi:MAG: zinc transporter ZupT, partial [Armatimonadota bacterium]